MTPDLCSEDKQSISTLIAALSLCCLPKPRYALLRPSPCHHQVAQERNCSMRINQKRLSSAKILLCKT